MGIHKAKGSPFWQYDFTVGGSRFRGSTQTDSKQTALAVEAKEREKAILAQYYVLPDELTISQAFGRFWLEHAQFLKAAASVRANITHVIAHFGDAELLSKIGQAELETYIAKCRAETYTKTVPVRDGTRLPYKTPRITTNATINRRMAVFANMHNKARLSWKIHVQTVDFRALKLPEADSIDRTITHEQAQRLMEVAPKHLRDFLYLSLYTGLRQSNVLNLRGCDIDLNSLTITVYGKSDKPGGKRITVAIPDALEAHIKAEGLHLQEWAVEYGGRPVSQVKTAWRAALKAAGLPYMRRHDLRHTVGTWIYQATGDLLAVKEALGHANISTSMRYSHTSKKRLRDILNVSLPESRQTKNPEDSGEPVDN
jgi:integrase